MSAIWKFTPRLGPLPVPAEVGMPHGAEILSFGAQGTSFVLWALVNPQSSMDSRRVWVVPTGYMGLPTEGLRFIGTAQAADGIVAHAFEVVA